MKNKKKKLFYARRGIYVHVPFVKEINPNYEHYQVKFKDNSIVNRYSQEIARDLVSYDLNFVKAVHFGGADIHCLGASHLKSIFQAISANLKSNIERSIEINFQDINSDFLRLLTFFNFNRIEVLVNDSFILEHFEAAQAKIKLAKTFFNNISFSVFYNLPEQKNEDLKKIILKTIQLKVQHIYLEQFLPFSKSSDRKKYYHHLFDKVQNFKVDIYDWMDETLQKAGYDRYAICYFSLNVSFRSRLALIYKTNGSYLGVGPSAVSYSCDKHYFDYKSLHPYNWKITRKYLKSYFFYQNVIINGFSLSSGYSLDLPDRAAAFCCFRRPINKLLKQKKLIFTEDRVLKICDNKISNVLEVINDIIFDI